MTNTIIPLAGTLVVVWRIVGSGLVIVLGTLWSWIMIASRLRAKAEQSLHDWLLRSHTSHLSRADTSYLAPETAAETDSANPGRTTRPAVHRQGF
jgi:hypothetical protein